MQRQQEFEEVKAAPARKLRKAIDIEEIEEAPKKDKNAKADVVMDEETPELLAALGNKFSVGKIAKFCKHGRFSERIGAGCPVYIAAVLEYITCEILELANVKC